MLSAAVCLVLRFEWNGQPLQAGRRPFYGAEVPNVKRSSSEPVGTRESVLYPLSPAPFGYLARMTASGFPVAVVLVPQLPPTAGELWLRLAVVPCANAPSGQEPRPPLLGGDELRISVFRPVKEGTGAGTTSGIVARGNLSEGAPLDLVLHFPPASLPEESVELHVASAAHPENAVRLGWSRFLHPGQERLTWNEAPPLAGAAPSRR